MRMIGNKQFFKAGLLSATLKIAPQNWCNFGNFANGTVATLLMFITHQVSPELHRYKLFLL